MRYRDIIGGAPWSIRVCWRGREVFYRHVPLRVSIGTHMGLWIRWGYSAQLQVSLFGTWWKPMMYLHPRCWRWECMFWTVTRFR